MVRKAWHLRCEPGPASQVDTNHKLNGGWPCESGEFRSGQSKAHQHYDRLDDDDDDDNIEAIADMVDKADDDEMLDDDEDDLDFEEETNPLMMAVLDRVVVADKSDAKSFKGKKNNLTR